MSGLQQQSWTNSEEQAKTYDFPNELEKKFRILKSSYPLCVGTLTAKLDKLRGTN